MAALVTTNITVARPSALSPSAMTDFFTPSPLTSSSTASPNAEYVSAGDVISSNPAGNLLGHGTLLVDNKMIATVSGHIERVNKLISVRPLSSRYVGDIGDIVVGRIAELGDQRWKVDIGARQHATLLLASIHLPGGALRRRTAEDQLAMRHYFRTGRRDCVRGAEGARRGRY